MKWKHHKKDSEDEEHWMFENKTHYYKVNSGARRTDEVCLFFIVSRMSLSDEIANDPEDYDGYLDKEGKCICGFGMFCAMGMPSSGYFDTKEEAMKITEQVMNKEIK